MTIEHNVTTAAEAAEDEATEIGDINDAAEETGVTEKRDEADTISMQRCWLHTLIAQAGCNVRSSSKTDTMKAMELKHPVRAKEQDKEIRREDRYNVRAAQPTNDRTRTGGGWQMKTPER